MSDGGQTQVDGVNPGDVLADSSFDKLQENTQVIVATGAPNKGAKPAASGGSGSKTQ